MLYRMYDAMCFQNVITTNELENRLFKKQFIGQSIVMKSVSGVLPVCYIQSVQLCTG